VKAYGKIGADGRKALWPVREARFTPCQLDESFDVLDYASEGMHVMVKNI
jgi:hypothetical protein